MIVLEFATREPCQPCADAARCDNPECGDRMCEVNGPEPRACGTTCADCPCDCESCLDAADDAESERLYRLERDARAS